MKSKSKRSDKELNKPSSSLGDRRKLFYNPLLADGSSQPTLGTHNESKSTGRNVSATRDKKVKTEKDNFAVKNCAPDTAEIGSVETITRQEHQSRTIHGRVPNDGADINVNTSFAGENSNETLNTYGSLFAPGNAVLPREESSTTCQEAMVKASVEEEGMSIKKNAAVLTDPECLGPCDPGSSVVLEGIVWNESRNGLLVVNVTWRGKTYVGTLMDSSNHHWGSPCFKDGSWNLEAKEDEGEGRRLRRNRVSKQKILRSSDQQPFHDEAAAAAAAAATTCTKEFTCQIPSCSKRFKSLSGLKTHKCVALRESSCNSRSCDAIPACPSNEKSLQTNQKPASKMNGRNKQGTLKRKNHLLDEHPYTPSHLQLKSCKSKLSDSFAYDWHATPKNASQKSNRDASAVKTLNHKRSEKQKKNGKAQNTQRKKKIKRASPASNNSSACKSNAFSNEFQSTGLLGRHIRSNGTIKLSSDCAPLRKTAVDSSSSSSVKDLSKDNFLHLFDQKQHENVVTFKSKCFTTDHHHSYVGPSVSKFAATTCSSPSHSGGICTKCSLAQPESPCYEPLKTPVCRSTPMPPGCGKTPTAEPSTAPTAVPCKISDDLFNTPLEANTASEVFGQDSKHYKQVGTSSNVEDFLFSKKQTT